MRPSTYNPDEIKHVVSGPPLSHRVVRSVKERLFVHVVHGQFAGQVGLPPGRLVTATRGTLLKHVKKSRGNTQHQDGRRSPQHLLPVSFHLTDQRLFVRLLVLLHRHLLQILAQKQTKVSFDSSQRES